MLLSPWRPCAQPGDTLTQSLLSQQLSLLLLVLLPGSPAATGMEDAAFPHLGESSQPLPWACPPALLLPPGRHGGLRWPGPAGVPQQHYQGRSAPLPAGGGGGAGCMQGAPVWEVLGWRVMGSGVHMQGKVLGVQVLGLVSVGVCISEVRGSGGTDIGCGRD